MTEDGNEHEVDYRIAVLHGNALFHQGGLNEDDGLEKGDI